MRDALIEMILADPWRLAALRTVRALSLPDWAIGAGFVRNLVWDRLHGYSPPTPLNDVDVLYFDRGSALDARQQEQDIELRLARTMPDVPWSARNQARMHLRNDDQPYRDTADAISFWLESATGVAVRLEADGTLSVIAPFGLDDLMSLHSRPTARGLKSYDRYCARMREKNWPARWPKLAVEGL